ncbi:hypothetical protein J6590_038916 [Homalodisca vitripennis]|nr:hypothetical protein J6590_038916 [Homalodisca vitripennis]
MTETDFVLVDGGFETQLRKYVGSGFEGHPLWICRYLVENPEACRKAHQDYIQCECLQNCTAAAAPYTQRYPDRDHHSRKVFQRLTSSVYETGNVQPERSQKGEIAH